jgi:anti-anti-sigma regulatory factor
MWLTVPLGMLEPVETHDSTQSPVPETRRWLTTVLRPAGMLNRPGMDQVARALTILAACSDMVVIDLTAATVTSPHALAQTLAAPAAELDQAGRCLLLRGVPPQVRAELDRAAIPAIALVDDAMLT